VRCATDAMTLRVRANLLNCTALPDHLIADIQHMFDPLPGYRLLISPELLSDADLERRLTVGPEIVWREEPHWRICRYATGHKAFALLQEGWELFDDGDESD